jgi:cellulose synthase operon protein C
VETLLLGSADRWSAKGRPDMALAVLGKLLALDPNQSEAVFREGMLYIQQGQVPEAQRALDRLHEMAPTSPRIIDLAYAISNSKVAGDGLGEARRLARDGHLAEAADTYRRIFGDAPPAIYAVEYYQTLAGTSTGWDEARFGLEQLVRISSGDPKVRLALAEILTYREDTRREGIEALIQLNADPAVGGDATKAWRQALSWQGDSAADLELYRQYLARFPNDSEIAERIAAVDERRDGSAAKTDAPPEERRYASELSEARRLAQTKRFSEAVAVYHTIFNGPPPPAYDIEYYMTLAGTVDGWDEARQALERLSRASGDAKLRLAWAEVMTYRGETRPAGMEALAELRGDPAVADAARRAWAHALTWLGGGPEDLRQLEIYLAAYPQDSDIRERYVALKSSAAAGGHDQSKALADMDAGRLEVAEREFVKILASSPRDVEAMAGLAFIRLRQQRFGDARDLLARAMAAAPDRRKQWQEAYGSATLWAMVTDAKAQSAAGNDIRAKAILKTALAHPRPGDWGAELVLGATELRLADYPAAEQTYRWTLKVQPQNTDASVGLARALRAQGKNAEAERVAARLSRADRSRVEADGSRGEKLRAEAKELQAADNYAAALAKFDEAIAAAPTNPWIRYDLARYLAGKGKVAQALEVVDPNKTGNTAEALMAAAWFDQEEQRWVEAIEKVDRIPAGQRTDEVRNFRHRVLVAATMQRVKQSMSAGDKTAARDLIITAYSDPQLNAGDRRALVSSMLYDVRDTDAAERLTRAGTVTKGHDGTAAAIDRITVLIDAKKVDEAATALAELETSGRVTADEEDDLTAAKVQLSLARAEKLRAAGNYAAADREIAPVLAERPNDAAVLMEAGRIAALSGHSAQAIDYLDQARDADTLTPELVGALVGAAIQARNFAKAEAYLADGMDKFPDNAALYYWEAQIDRARGNNSAALEALYKAKALNKKQAAAASPPNLPSLASVPAAATR